MNPAQTNTQIYRPAEVVERLTARVSNAGSHYVARHSTDAPPSDTVRHWPRHARTETISAVRVQAAREAPETARIPVALMPVQVPAARPVVTPAVEPPAEVTVGLLERVLRRLRGMR